MFEFTPLTEAEATRLEGKIRVSEDRRRLLIPCRAVDGCACTIYPDRPASCRAFRCRVLASLEAGALTDAQAHETIAEILERRRALAIAVGAQVESEALELARQQLLAGIASEEVKEGYRRFKQALVLLQLQPEDIFRRAAKGA